jgi:alpha-tubulin suppressor-like RCC1 family protein
VFPEKNAFFDAVKHHGLTITKMKTANEGTVALLSDGTLYGWGRNFRG